jgi:hypothetical protein
MCLRLGLRNIKNRLGGEIMEKEQLEIKRAELKVYIDNFNLSSETEVKKLGGLRTWLIFISALKINPLESCSKYLVILVVNV